MPIPELLELVSQVGLTLFSASSAWYLSRGEVKRGCALGLFSEIFWGYTAVYNMQPGVIAMVLWFAGCYATGLYKVLSEERYEPMPVNHTNKQPPPNPNKGRSRPSVPPRPPKRFWS